MPCYAPAKAYYSAEKGESGKRALVFKASQSHSGAPLRIPCGQCIGCRLDKAREWTIRLTHEQKLHNRSCFLTLTKKDIGDGSLHKTELQNFIKRLRHHTGDGLRYYGVGEYGGKFGRPHYHVLLLSFDFDDKRLWMPGKREGEYIYRSSLLEKLWTEGHSSIGECTPDSIAYVARYVTKKITGPQADLHYKGAEPEFSLMSLSPASELTTS